MSIKQVIDDTLSQQVYSVVDNAEWQIPYSNNKQAANVLMTQLLTSFKS